MAIETQNRKTWWSRLIKGLNNLMNPGHAWRDYENDPDANSTLDNVINTVQDVLSEMDTNSTSIANRITQAHQTGAEIEAQEFSANEAQKSRDFTEYMARNKYQMETQSMEQAGVNPAMVYGGGSLVPTATNGAQGQASSPGASALNPFDIMMTMARMGRELSLLDSQKANIDKDTELKEKQGEKIGAETDLLGLQVKYYPNLTEKQIEKLDAEIGVDNARKDELVSETALNNAKKVLQDAENKYADEFYQLRNALTSAQKARELSRKDLNVMNTAMLRIEKEYMEKYDMKMGTSEAYSICMALMSMFNTEPSSLIARLKEYVKFAFSEGQGDNPIVKSLEELFSNKPKEHHLVRD